MYRVALSYQEARDQVVAEMGAAGARPEGTADAEEVALEAAAGRVLAEEVVADRDQPPFHRSTRDGFAVRASEVPGALRVVGEAPAGSAFTGRVGAGECVEIMTGAPLPDGADAVVMVEHVTRAGDRVEVGRGVAPGENVVPAGSELAAGARAVARGTRLRAAEIALLASVGRARVRVGRLPRVAIVATGEEIVDVTATPGPFQIRNSNTYSLAAQVLAAGGAPLRLAPARDELGSLRAQLERAFAEGDLVLLSGGVSAGKYDLVEQVLAELGARFVWDSVDIRPGKPAVFGFARGVPFFGLPGNPVSTMVTFELFARPAVELAAGAKDVRLRLLHAPLAGDFSQRALALTVFAPATLDEAGRVTVIPTQGSGDIAAAVRADGFAVLAPGLTRVAAGTMVPFLPRC
jgi:molybdopterin molybdotransferase